MGFVSPKQVYDDPKLWLNVLHEMHESLNSLMDMMFPQSNGLKWSDRLTEFKVHCLLCEGFNKIPVIVIVSGKLEDITGYIGDEPNIEYFRTTKN